MARKNLILVSLGLFAGAAALLRAADPAPDAQLRSSLRAMTLELRTARSDLTTLQTAQTALAEEKKQLAEQVAALKKQLTDERLAAEKNAGDLKTRFAREAAMGAQLSDDLKKTKEEAQKQGEAVRLGTELNAKLQAENVVLQRKIADREARNLALFLLGNEILSKFEDFSLGKALAAKEPFVGTRRVRLENLVQDYEDKLADQRVKP